MAQTLVNLHGDYLGGRFVRAPEAQVDTWLERVSPRDSSEVLARVPVRYEAGTEAVACARRAFKAWARASLEVRTRYVHTLRDALAARADDFAHLLACEVGKPLWEARTEVSAALQKIAITLSDGLTLVAPRTVAKGQHYAFRPHGVAVVLGPFNFPLHLPHGHIVPLLLTGNTVVFKPSELAPLVGQLYAECLHAAGFPLGVVNVVQGDGEQGARLAQHADVDAVMLTGSYAVGQAIKRATIDQPHKLLALELGGRNPAIVLADADLDKAVHDVTWGAFVTAGQRCSGTAVALVARERLAAFVAAVQRQVRAIVVGDPLTEGVFMGPLISEAARVRYLAALHEAESAGVEVVCGATLPALTPGGAYVTPSVHLLHRPLGTNYEREELFGPDLCIEPVDGLEHAIERANASSYGLAVSVFTSERAAFEEALHELRFGCVNFNAPTCGASSRLPFGGTRRSGNHRPAALFSSWYATYPVASLEGASTLEASVRSPGFGEP